MPDAAVRKTVTHLTDGRELIYFDRPGAPDRGGYRDPGPG
jgi:hypothetical protein